MLQILIARENWILVVDALNKFEEQFPELASCDGPILIGNTLYVSAWHVSKLFSIMLG